MPETILYGDREIPLLGCWDTVVVGGGSAGAAAGSVETGVVSDGTEGCVEGAAFNPGWGVFQSRNTSTAAAMSAMARISSRISPV